MFCYFVVPVTSSPRRRRRGVFSPKAAKQKWDAIEKNVSTTQITFDLYQILSLVSHSMLLDKIYDKLCHYYIYMYINIYCSCPFIRARFQLYWDSTSKLSLSREATPLIWPLFHGRRDAYKRRTIVYFSL